MIVHLKQTIFVYIYNNSVAVATQTTKTNKKQLGTFTYKNN